MLQAVRNPQGKWIRFEYDALGRRTAKIVNTKIYRYLWDGNVLLHEWFYESERRPKVVSDELGMLMLEQPEPIENLTTWVYEEGSLVPTAKLSEGKSYSIVSDYLGRPAQAYDEKGELIWQVEFDIYGRIRENLFNNKQFIPFRQLGQYEDIETGLYYNRFRYYNPQTGTYISKDPIGLAGNNPNLYAYTFDSNTTVDPFGLDIINGVPQNPGVVRRFMSKSEYKAFKKNGFKFDPIDSRGGISVTSTKVKPKNPDAIKRSTGALGADYFVDIDTKGKTKGGVMDLFKKIEKYFYLREEIRELLSNLEMNNNAYSENQKDLLYRLMKDCHFEAKVFEIILHIDKKIAIDYIKKFYLDGSPKDKVRFKGSLDIMLDDYNTILGKDEFDELINSLPKSTKDFPFIKEAIEFVEDE